MAVSCNSSSHCPESSPCCSQYGECGTGLYCLGGCDIRYSYNLTACMPMPRMKSFNTTFKSLKDVEKQSSYLGKYKDESWIYSGYVGTHDNALLLQMPKESAGTVISSTEYLWYGKIKTVMKTSRGNGVISAFILFSDVQDEVDFEFVGYNLTHPQSNYYSQGILNYSNAENSTTTDIFENYHTYEIEWKEDELNWFIDDDKVRTLKRADTWNETTKRYDFPQTPSRIQLSLWPGGDSKNGLGTIEWAGGAIDWDSEDIKKYGYFYAHVKSIHVEAYDIPDNLLLDGSDDPDDLHAFLYNSTKGNAKNIYLTNKKTWLGSEDATGLDPDNDDDDDSSTSASHLASHASRSSKSKSKSKSTSKTSGAASKTSSKASGNNGGSTTVNYHPTESNGFVQFATADSASASATSKNSSPSINLEKTMSILAAIFGGYISILV